MASGGRRASGEEYKREQAVDCESSVDWRRGGGNNGKLVTWLDCFTRNLL